jgi:type VI secretion system protein ImpL
VFKKILKFLLIVIIWLLIGVALVGGCILLDYPGEYGLYIFLGLLLVWYGVKLIRKLYRRHQAAQRVKQLINVEAPEAENDDSERVFGLWRRRTELETSFRGLLQTLNMTELSRRGDPLYVLPWIAVIGDAEPASSELIQGARLPAPTIDVKRPDDNSTGIDWHLYNQSLLISTPAEFMHGGPAISDSRWLELLTLLVRHRGVEPLNGLVVTLPARVLLEGDTENLMDRAQKARRLIEDSVQVLGVQVPVYVMVTGLEEMEGVSQWLERLDDDALRQAVGQINEQGSGAEELAVTAVEALASQIRMMNLAAVRGSQLPPDLMRLPVRVRDMTHSLKTFMATLFQDNPYQKTPPLRGLYFACMTQRREHPVSAFTYDVFGRIVPADRARVQPVAVQQRQTLWRERRRTLAWTGAAGLALFVLSALYLNDYGKLENLRESQVQLRATSDPGVSGALEKSLRTRQQDLELIRTLQDTRWLPWLPFGGEQAFIDRMQSRFSMKVQEELIAPIDEAFLNTLTTDFFNVAFNPDDKGLLDAVGAYTGILVRRINLLNAYMSGASADELRAMPMPYDAGEVQAVSRELLGTINELYLQSLLWRDRSAGDDEDIAAVRAQRDEMVATLDRILGHSGDSLAWVIDWLNGNPNYEGYDLADQWDSGSRSMERQVRVAGAYTLAGKDAIESYLDELQRASPDSEALGDMLPGFFRVYRRQYLNAWETFATEYQLGLTRLANADDYLLYINSLSTGRNQYFNALDLVYSQTAPFIDQLNNEGEDLPDWLFMLDYYNDMASLSPDEGTDTSARDRTLAKLALKTVGTAGPLGKALAKSGKKGLKTKKKLDKAGGGPSKSERMLRLEQAAGLLGDYRDALNDFVFNAERRSVSYTAMRNRFQNADNPGGGSGSLAKAHGVLRELQALVGKPNRDNRAFWTLFAGPVELIEAYALQEASCQFNEEYRNDFLAAIEGVPEYRKPGYTYGPDGILWTFMDNAAAPFVTQKLGAGYVRVSAGDLRLPINSELLRYATRALDQRNARSEVAVEIKTKPTQTNLDALYGVSESRLQLQCPAGSKLLVNRNFANSEVFTWNDQCADTRLRLAIGAIEVEKTYTGPTGFPRFLDDFRSGSKRFTPADFPRHEQQLREYGVTFIDVQYNLSGHQAILRLLDTRPDDPPARASACWNQGS